MSAREAQLVQALEQIAATAFTWQNIEEVRVWPPGSDCAEDEPVVLREYIRSVLDA